MSGEQPKRVARLSPDGRRWPCTTETVMHRYLATYGEPETFKFVPTGEPWITDGVGSCLCGECTR